MDTADGFRRSLVTIPSGEALAALSLEELKALQERLHGGHELRFERR